MKHRTGILTALTTSVVLAAGLFMLASAPTDAAAGIGPDLFIDLEQGETCDDCPGEIQGPGRCYLYDCEEGVGGQGATCVYTCFGRAGG